jgi:signal transduction histidine kinase/DNA-binding NarL/FixJ family response regulator
VIRSSGGYWASQAGIVIVAAVLIGLAWGAANIAIHADRDQAEARAEASVSVEALAFEQQIQRQLLAFDQTLRFLRQQWEQDPRYFDLGAGRAHAVLLSEVSGSLFMTNEHGVVVQSSTPAAVGTDLSRSEMFRALLAQPDDTDLMYVGPATRSAIDQNWHMNLGLRLFRRDGRFAGVLAVTYSTDALSRFFHEAHLGPDDLIAVVGMAEGRVRAEVARVPIAPNTSLSGSAMLQAMQEMPDGVWIGPSAPDGVDRIHAFRRIPDRGLEVAVGLERKAALKSTATWTVGARLFAGGTTAVVLLAAGLLLRETRDTHQRAVASAQEQARLEAHNAELAAARARADAKAAQLQATLAGMTDGVVMVDADYHLMEWNSQFPEIAGVPPDILRVGVSMEEMIRAQAEGGEFGDVDVEAEVARRMRLLRSGKLAGATERLRPNGTFIELRRNYLPDGGIVTLFTDITARKQVENALRIAREAAEDAAAAKSRFTAIVSHEIRTPLSALLNSLQLLGDAPLPPPQRTLLELACQSGEALSGLINDILDMSRLEAGQLALRRSVFALRPLLNGTLGMLRALAARRGITLRSAVDNDLPQLVYGDPVRLRQILLNLLGNAAKYAAPGEVVLGATMLRRDAGPMLRLAVRDQGPAIPDEERARLFQPFAQLDQPEDESPTGTGLGLSICHLLAHLMEGAIGCDTVTLSALGERQRLGNEFWVELPLAPLPADAVVQPVAAPAPPLVLPRTRVLLAEDVAANRKVVARMLRRSGHLVDAVGGAEAAIEAVKVHPYDIVLMDVHMPGMSGIDGARHIRTLPAPAGTVPIIALTAALIEEEVIQCRAAGMNGIVDKPVSLGELLEALGSYAWPGQVQSLRAPARGVSPMPARIPTESILSIARLEELRRHMPAESVTRLVEEALLEMRTRLPALRDALRVGDIARLASEAHAMQGVASGYGMSALHRRLQDLSAAARDQGPRASAALGELLEAELARTADALRAFFSIETV